MNKTTSMHEAGKAVVHAKKTKQLQIIKVWRAIPVLLSDTIKSVQKRPLGWLMTAFSIFQHLYFDGSVLPPTQERVLPPISKQVEKT